MQVTVVIGLALGCSVAQAQEPRAVVRGVVVDAVSAEPLPGATVVLVPSDPLQGMVTDSLGAFSFNHVPVGHYAMRVEYVGYEPMVVPEVWARSGKDAVHRVELSPAAVALEVFTVSALAREDHQALGVRTMTVEQSLRYPAMFFDPARVAASTAGVNTANDQANHMSIRGNSPNANSWLLEGAEMVNPNHTANAGTANDLPTLSGGGVIMLSSQMLGPSRLLTGSLPIDRSNSVGGVMDMELRNGSAAGQEWTAQAGLLGIDLATEGPFRAGGRSSYVVNYRYSTLGLLGAMGVELGDEAIDLPGPVLHGYAALRQSGRGKAFWYGRYQHQRLPDQHRHLGLGGRQGRVGHRLQLAYRCGRQQLACAGGAQRNRAGHGVAFRYRAGA